MDVANILTIDIQCHFRFMLKTKSQFLREKGDIFFPPIRRRGDLLEIETFRVKGG